MKKIDISKYICTGAILTTITVLFQAAPILMPTIGLAFSPLSTLPIAISAVVNISLGFVVFISSAFILAFVSVQETIILLFTTGLLGIVIGALLFRKGVIISILLSSIALSFGMICLTYIINISAFVQLTKLMSTPLILLTFFLFSFIYSCIWNFGFRKFMKYIIKIKIIS